MASLRMRSSVFASLHRLPLRVEVGEALAALAAADAGLVVGDVAQAGGLGALGGVDEDGDGQAGIELLAFVDGDGGRHGVTFAGSPALRCKNYPKSPTPVTFLPERPDGAIYHAARLRGLVPHRPCRLRRLHRRRAFRVCTDARSWHTTCSLSLRGPAIGTTWSISSHSRSPGEPSQNLMNFASAVCWKDRPPLACAGPADLL